MKRRTLISGVRSRRRETDSKSDSLPLAWRSRTSGCALRSTSTSSGRAGSSRTILQALLEARRAQSPLLDSERRLITPNLIDLNLGWYLPQNDSAILTSLGHLVDLKTPMRIISLKRIGTPTATVRLRTSRAPLGTGRFQAGTKALTPRKSMNQW